MEIPTAHLCTVTGAVRLPGAVALSERDGELHSPNPLYAPRSMTPAPRLSCFTEPISLTRKEAVPMDFCHFPVKIVKRSKGRSAVEAAAYRSGTKLTNE